MDIDLYRRPTGPVAEAILSIVTDLTGVWFTPDVAPATRRDLLFHDVFCAAQDGRIRAFVAFTSHDGAIHITLMGTSPEYRGQGIGSALMKRLESHAETLGFNEIVAFTVPPASKPVYQTTVDFYQKHGFRVVKEHRALWQSGALELRKSLKEGSQQCFPADAEGGAAEG
jgi:ribosomal protein S18 acetylase RimI-like enzyme